MLFVPALIAYTALWLGADAVPTQSFGIEGSSHQLAARVGTSLIQTGAKLLATHGFLYKSAPYPASPDVKIAESKGKTVEDIMKSKRGIGGVYMFNDQGTTITKLSTAVKSQVQSKSSYATP